MLTGFTAGLLLITISELGDKTFFIAALLAMRHPRRWVFLGVTAALWSMTILSVLLGRVATILPAHYVQGIAIALFLGFGIKLLFDASRMNNDKGMAEEEQEAIATIRQTNTRYMTFGIAFGTIMIQAFTLTFLGEWGDRTQIATITLAAANHPLGVTVGASLGHAICAAIAVLCGRMIAGRISERWVTALGGLLFLIFGAIALLQIPN
jgi:putative Ca2+/H+ antiporter (TMEM165/GDT1 family)